MNIKSILLGTAAALVAVSGARAADAVVMVEPEPVDYVRVCDVYGTGFFYIPGTETCLKIGGYVRMRLEANDQASNGATNLDGDDDYNFRTRVRTRLNFDTREETELGTLRAFARVQATNSSGSNASYTMDQAYIQLGGLTVGYLDSLWAERDGLYTDNDWSVGDFNQNRVSYTYTASGFSAAVSVEDDGDGDFVPDVIGQLAYEGGWGSAYISGVYDEDTSADYAGTAGYTVGGVTFPVFLDGVDSADDAADGAFALKAGVELKDLLAAGSLFKIEGSYATDPTVYAYDTYLYQNQAVNTVFSQNQEFTANIPSEYQIGAAYQQKFGKLTAILSGVYGKTFDFYANGDKYDGSDYYGVAGNVGYQVTTNFSVLGEVAYRDIDVNNGDDFGQTTGFIEFQRTF